MDQTIPCCLVLIPALPLLAALVVALLGAKWLKENSHYPIVFALGLSFICALVLVLEVGNQQVKPSPAGFERVVNLWTWADIPNAYEMTGVNGQSTAYNFRVDIALRADALTSTMLAMVTFVATLVAIFAAGYMHGEPGYWRFYSYFGLFVFSMTMLVSVSNFVLLFVFWEAVGVCSYLLIGFWYHKPEAAAAGKKAFLVNRVGDFGFALALFLIWSNYGTLNYHDTLSNGATVQSTSNTTEQASESLPLVSGVLGQSRITSHKFVTGSVATAICLLLMLGACGKSAQFPLHVWLPDAMEGPTPVSALIHAATMVTAGVYMVTRCTPLFMVAPDAQLVVACIGGLTALLAGLIALTQHDLKRVLAYSTVSQLGFMFLGLGTGLFTGIAAGMFHLFTHAFFKALLFLGSGSVMHAMHHIIDMRRFGGLRKIMPYTHATFLVGCLALSGIFPLAGFWSKDAIVAALHDKAHHLQHEAEAHSHAAHVHDSHEAEKPHLLPKLSPPVAALHSWVYQNLYYLSLFVAFLTAFYTFRAFFMTFYGEEVVPHEVGDHAHESPQTMTFPLVALAVCAVLVGAMFIYDNFAGNRLFDFLGHTPSLAAGAIAETKEAGKFHLDVAALSTIVAVSGIVLAMYLYMGDRSEAIAAQQAFDLQGLQRYTDVQWVARLKQVPLIATWEKRLRSVGLGWLVSIAGLVLGLFALVVAIPLTLGTFVTPYRLSLQKFFFDELYVWFIVRPCELLADILYWLDKNLIDALVNLCGQVPRKLGDIFRQLQMGLVQFYAVAMLLGAIVLLTAGMLWGAK